MCRLPQPRQILCAGCHTHTNMVCRLPQPHQSNLGQVRLDGHEITNGGFGREPTGASGGNPRGLRGGTGIIVTPFVGRLSRQSSPDVMVRHHETSLDISELGKHAWGMTHSPYTLVLRTKPAAVMLTSCRWLDFARTGAARCP